MQERILELKKLYDLGISRETFLLMVLHCTNTSEDTSAGYANYLKLEKWQELFAKKPNPSLELNVEQIREFFNYMSKYYFQYVGKNDDKYYVNKSFNNDLRDESNFEFESVVYYTLKLK